MGDSPSNKHGRLLTIHLRAGDTLPFVGKEDRFNGVTDYLNLWMWQQPPCAFYEYIQRSKNYAEMLVVSNPPGNRVQHPCIEWLKHRYANNSKVSLHFQSSSMANDTATIFRATHLVLSFSTFSESLAVWSGRARKIYKIGVWQRNTIMDCTLWKGASIERYDMPYRFKQSERASLRWPQIVEKLTASYRFRALRRNCEAFDRSICKEN